MNEPVRVQRRAKGVASGACAHRGGHWTSRRDDEELDPEASRKPASPSPSKPGVIVAHRTGRWFITPEGVRVNLLSRKSLTILVRRLGERRCEAPAALLPADGLISDMWPGEKILRRAGRNRLHVAVRTLRKMGLGSRLRFEGGGYQLDPTVPFEFVEGDEHG